MYTRQDYMDGKVSHSDYYSQFVTKDTRVDVTRFIGISRILESTDEHMNDIPLHLWDSLGASLRFDRALKSKCDPRGGISKSDLVCIAKQCARELKQSNFKL